MGFYGDTLSSPNGTNLNIVFDKIYPNRKSMDESVLSDGVFINRYVLVSYIQDKTFIRKAYFKNSQVLPPPLNYTGEFYRDLYEDIAGNILLKPKFDETNKEYSNLFVYVSTLLTIPGNSEDREDIRNIYYYFEWDEDRQQYKYIFPSKSLEEKNEYMYNFYIDEEAYGYKRRWKDMTDEEYEKLNPNKNEDSFLNGYHATVWRKTVINGQMKYQFITSLRTQVPNMTIVPVAPSESTAQYPYFSIREIQPQDIELSEEEVKYPSIDDSTDLSYQLHIAPPWGFRVKQVSDEDDVKIDKDDLTKNKFNDLYIFKDGFNIKKSLKDDKTKDEIIVKPDGISGQPYFDHYTNTYVPKEDMYQLSIHLPSIGNSISEMYDRLYGNYREDGSLKKDRNLKIDFSDNTESGVTAFSKVDGYMPYKMQSMAGALNSVFDLMGRIIKKDDTLEDTNQYEIVYRTKDNDGNEIAPRYYIKAPKYSFQPKTYTSILKDRDYKKLEQYEKDKYYRQVNSGKIDEKGKPKYNYLRERSETFNEQGITYYEINDKNIQPIDLINNNIDFNATDENVFFKKDEKTGDYIRILSKDDIEAETTYYGISEEESFILPEFTTVQDRLKITRAYFRNTEFSEEYVDETDGGTYARHEIVAPWSTDEDQSATYYRGYFWINEDNGIEPVVHRPTKNNVYQSVYQKPTDTQYYLFIDHYTKKENSADDGTNSIIYYIDGEPLSSQDYINYKVDLINYDYKDPIYIKYINGGYFDEAKQIENNKDKLFDYHLISIEERNDLQQFSPLDEKSKRRCYRITPYIKVGDTGEVDESGKPVIRYFYQKDKYYYRYVYSADHPNVYDYRLATDEYDEDLVSIQEGEDKPRGYYDISSFIQKTQDLKFYEPGVYYFYNKQTKSEELDYGKTLKTWPKDSDVLDRKEFGRDPSGEIDEKLIYFLKETPYVMSDKNNIYSEGAIWNVNSNPPEGVQLGTLIPDQYTWKELFGFAEDKNTINGLIVQLNNLCMFGDNLTRDPNTIQGNINRLKDLYAKFDNLTPGKLLIVDTYGRITTPDMSLDHWIQINIQDEVNNCSISFSHNGPSDNTTEIGETIDDTIPEDEIVSRTLGFGDSFKSFKLPIDEKGHLNKARDVNITLPSLSITNGTTGNVLTSLEISANGQSIVANSSDIGTLQLVSYKIKGDAELAANDSINDAFGKLQGQIKALDFTDSDANTTEFISKITQTDGKISVERHNAGDLVLTGYSVQEDSKLSANDSINKAFGKLQGQIDALDFADTNANTTQFISKITQTDGKINVERHNAGDLVLTGYSVATSKTAITTTDTINSAFGKVEYRLNILQADSTQEGSVAYQIAQIVNENNNGSIDTLNEIAEWIINDKTGAAKMNADISNLKTDVSSLKEQVQTASTGLLDRTTSLENLVGEKTVSAQINEALFINDEAIYASASDLSNSNQRIEELESHVDTWNTAEANVQSDWNESDEASDAYIVNKPDLTNIIETTSQFDYTIGDTTNQLTIAQLVAKVAELEAIIQTLTPST